MSVPASPIFVADNTPVKVGQFGKIINLTIKIYNKLYNTNVLIKKNGTTVTVIPTIDNITTHSKSFGVQIRVPGIQYTFPLHLTSAHDFTTYMVEACNKIGCNYFDVRVQSASKYTNKNKWMFIFLDIIIHIYLNTINVLTYKEIVSCQLIIK